MKNPIFAYGTYEELKNELAKGKKSRIYYPAYVWLKDTLQYAYVNKQGEIERMGIPMFTGTLDNQIVLSELEGGIYAIKGQYVITENSDTTFLAASPVFAIVQKLINDVKVRVITADNIYDYKVSEQEVVDSDINVTTKYLEEHHYTTETEVDDKIAVVEVTLKEELTDYVDEIIVDQIETLVPEEVDKAIKSVPEQDIYDMFNTASI